MATKSKSKLTTGRDSLQDVVVRLDRGGYRIEHFKEEIRHAENVLDEMRADYGLPLHRRIASLRNARTNGRTHAPLADDKL